MRLPILRTLPGRPLSKYGGALPQAWKILHLLIVGVVAGSLASLSTIGPAFAQQANQPGFNPRQTEKYFDDQQYRRARPAERPTLRMPQFERPKADAKPLFVLHAVSIAGAAAIPRERLAAL